MSSGIITEIQRFSLHDGPGIRTTVFFKGCQLRCKWCHNPETISTAKEIMWYKNKCRSCGICKTVCPEKRGRTESCLHCGKCVDSCPAGALGKAGRGITAEDVVTEILEDVEFYGKEGGVTLSGGEPVLQNEFAAAILEQCKKHNINTAIETNLSYPWEMIEKLLDHLDMIIFDIKIWDNEKHMKYTGKGNHEILDNIKKLDKYGKRLIARTPLLKGVNDLTKPIEPIAVFLSKIKNIEYYELLTYHFLGNEKYTALGLETPDFLPPENEALKKLSETLLKYPLKLLINGERIES